MEFAGGEEQEVEEEQKDEEEEENEDEEQAEASLWGSCTSIDPNCIARFNPR